MQTASLDPPPLLRDGCIEFPVHHVRGGTSTGLVISEHWAPREQTMREELLRHLMGLPLEGTRAGNKQITGLGRIVPTGNKVFFARLEADGNRAPHRQHLRAARGRQGGDRLERELRQHDRGAAALGTGHRAGRAGRCRRRVRDRHLQHQHRRDGGLAHAARRRRTLRRGRDPWRRRRFPRRRPVPRQSGGREDRTPAADRTAGGRRRRATRCPASTWRCRW